ncbi:MULTISPECIES: gamma-glutamyltransferase [Pseudoalteromonas]|jgi:gamma-glutamyltranspeptidase/glutathione hydrolase|uniref:gamma-glutamyltransferase n=1 Tax=Pseudoalteromonas TaxID=53246 RepID=UPI0002E43C83|nr:MULTISPECIES: gamma-glutamyltransferase [Pseudoalteromonas]MAY57632.1 gamma-glutamyltransferase [Pseudoalteromonas sp.]MDN3396790.1 gamma-glutamyltransferase [Pseudoalteromonas sp. APC 3215]MDN3400787.1 gamma-glutamyltransferase [Pseudoalteromonas sp. APC 3213]MDN3408542.1 gamma-glutamyltransferase [Pseudoalteromonas sp. APC 3894]MDN3415219.1 gamma-glutamyltransferase [Pseudoalteromonas sp. APC 3227]|tara:strand:- start:2595 stop:4259 length:1665 start_codon:yes stop_codon:yes gene_type:complete
MGSLFSPRKLIISSVLIIQVGFFNVAAKQSAVAMPDTFSAHAAKAVLEQGGNAIDAAIAAQFVLAVTLPEAGNIGGGGFMLIHKDGKGDFIDYRETAPSAAHRDMYLDEQGQVIENKSIYGIHASGVPGSVAGMWLAHKKHGTLPWKALVQPAVTLAEQGFVVPEKLAQLIEDYIAHLNNKNIKVNFASYFATATAGALFKQPELAATLKRIRDDGQDGFYQGETAAIIAKFMHQHGGIINQDDLKRYRAKSRTPIKANWNGYQVLTSPPPSSGGIAILQWLKMYELKKPTPAQQHNSVGYVHLLAEIGKRVFADRAEYLGDPDFYQVPTAKLLAENYLKNRSSSIDLKAISTTENIKPGLKESEQTTHFSIVDNMGNAVANTTTINLGFGSGVVVEGAGFILNDEMDDFSAKPGVMNVFGAIGGKANEIQPHKRMLSSMTPTILLSNNQVKMVTGSPGGTTIISSVYQSILNAIEFNMSADDVVNSPRFHHQLWPKNVIRAHAGLEPSVKQQLIKMGYTVDERHFGDMHVIINHNGKLDAASEQSGRGKAIVF